MKPFDSNKKKYKLKSHVTWPPKTRATITSSDGLTQGETVELRLSIDVSEAAAATRAGRAVSCPPVITNSWSEPGLGAGHGERGEGGVGDQGPEDMEHQDWTGGDDDDLAASRHEGRPPQSGGVEPVQPELNLDQLWTQVKRRLTPWRLACHSNCGHVCSVRRQRRT